ncbi:hypothetical protein BV25DRAFT_1423872 [Artomyces pyxidatus]|uniref:Uncharacterized protein n=1 Tax=Artomyces pyxidatus TaxID=48021 RepID=A0ACB8TE94_9AGAM|nr:hypothetical protein BV25DRAFT_1423872 [Artomyces pyxidatus]
MKNLESLALTFCLPRSSPHRPAIAIYLPQPQQFTVTSLAADCTCLLKSLRLPHDTNIVLNLIFLEDGGEEQIDAFFHVLTAHLGTNAISFVQLELFTHHSEHEFPLAELNAYRDHTPEDGSTHTPALELRFRLDYEFPRYRDLQYVLTALCTMLPACTADVRRLHVSTTVSWDASDWPPILRGLPALAELHANKRAAKALCAALVADSGMPGMAEGLASLSLYWTGAPRMLVQWLRRRREAGVQLDNLNVTSCSCRQEERRALERDLAALVGYLDISYFP